MTATTPKRAHITTTVSYRGYSLYSDEIEILHKLRTIGVIGRGSPNKNYAIEMPVVDGKRRIWIWKLQPKHSRNRYVNYERRIHCTNETELNEQYAAAVFGSRAT